MGRTMNRHVCGRVYLAVSASTVIHSYKKLTLRHCPFISGFSFMEKNSNKFKQQIYLTFHAFQCSDALSNFWVSQLKFEISVLALQIVYTYLENE